MVVEVVAVQVVEVVAKQHNHSEEVERPGVVEATLQLMGRRSLPKGLQVGCMMHPSLKAQFVKRPTMEGCCLGLDYLQGTRVSNEKQVLSR